MDRADERNDLISIDWSPTQEHLSGQVQTGPVFEATASEFLLRIPQVGRYHVTRSAIRIAPDEGADERSVRAFLMGSGLGAVLHLRGIPVLHGSAIIMPDGTAAVFSGLSTAGKSTLAMALARRGHPMLADDMAALRMDGQGQAWCLPGLARTKLWGHALQRLGLEDQRSQASQVQPDMDKYALVNHVVQQAAPLTRFYELRAQEGGELVFSTITGLEKINALVMHTFRPTFLAAVGGQPRHLTQLARIAPKLKMGRIDRPRHAQTLDAIVDELESQWRQ